MIVPNDPLRLYNEQLETFTLVIKDMGILKRECREMNMTPAEFTGLSSSLSMRSLG